MSDRYDLKTLSLDIVWDLWCQESNVWDLLKCQKKESRNLTWEFEVWLCFCSSLWNWVIYAENLIWLFTLEVVLRYISYLRLPNFQQHAKNAKNRLENN